MEDWNIHAHFSFALAYDEDISHIFFECIKSVACWKHTSIWTSLLSIVDPTLSFASTVYLYSV